VLQQVDPGARAGGFIKSIDMAKKRKVPAFATGLKLARLNMIRNQRWLLLALRDRQWPSGSARGLLRWWRSGSRTDHSRAHARLPVGTRSHCKATPPEHPNNNSKLYFTI